MSIWCPLEDMNIVRKYLSVIGGGKLVLLTPATDVVSLIAVDELADVRWGPTVPDYTTFSFLLFLVYRRYVDEVADSC